MIDSGDNEMARTGMNGIIDGCVDNSCRRMSHHSPPTGKQDGGMVIPMEQNEGFLVYHNEKGVE